MNKPIHKQPGFGEDDDSEADQFYESLDRIAASTSCSTSNSDDSDPDPPPQFSNYDLWISEPSSVSERRRTLLRHMGLSYDSSLSRPLAPPPDLNFTPPHPFPASHFPGVSRSKSDSGIDRRDGDDYHAASPPLTSCNHDFNSFSSSFVSSSILSGDVNSYSTNQNDKTVAANSEKNGSVVGGLKHTKRSSSSPKFSATASPSKPPSGKHGRSMDVPRSFSNTSIRELEEGGSDCPVVDDTEAVELAQACTIKNLDTGREFVVNEIREDGMWNKLKEVGTGRQLTMEEFEMTVGHSPIVQELMRRQSVEDGARENQDSNCNGINGTGGSKLKKKGGWLRSIKNVASSVKGHKERSSDEKDTGSERGGRRSSSATDDSQDVSFHGPERVRVKQYGKSFKELTAVFKSQEIQAHTGSIWAIKFSLDGRYLASAGEDCVIHVWQVVEAERKGELLLEKPEDANFNLLVTVNGSPEPMFLSTSADGHSEKRRRGRSSLSRKSLSLEHIIVPETVFALTDKPVCSFEGHIDDVLDLSWSKSQVSVV
ncbi:WD repeat-containing protein 44 [Linum grandiflorum]